MKTLNLCIALSLLLFSCSFDDDGATKLIEQCAVPTNLVETNITFSKATISWDDANGASNFRIHYGPVGFALGSGVTYGITGTSVTLVNLQPETTYDYYIHTFCELDNYSMFTEVRSFTTARAPVVPEFKPTLSELNLFEGDLKNLEPSIYAFEYDLNTPLFTDYAHKQRLIALPPGTTMQFDGDGLPLFPDNTLIAKTFYYNIDDRDESLGKKIIETRILIKKNGAWQTGNYLWNASQTEAALDPNGHTIPVVWTDVNGNSENINYKVPSNADCFTCHQSYNQITPIGPKLQAMNFNVNGVNQLQKLKDLSLLNGLSSPSNVTVLPNWEDHSYSLSDRARAYLDMNCAHCHSAGGYCIDQVAIDLRYSIPYEQTNIENFRFAIMGFTSFYMEGVSMPLIGTSMMHQEGYNLIEEYIFSL